MRIERPGGPPDLQATFRQFVVRNLNGRALDDQKDEEARLGKFPDFACFRDLVLIEMKHLEADQTDRVNDTYKRRVVPEEEPLFYGSRRIDLDKLSNGADIKSAILNKLSQTLESQLRKANRQFEEYRRRNPRKNSVSIGLVLNSQIDAFSPDVVMHALHRKMKLTGEGLRFPSIDGVIYISEKHFQQLPDGRAAFAIVTLIGVPAVEEHWKMPIVDLVARRWSEFRTGASPAEGNVKGFQSVEDIPDRMARHEIWKLAYRRNPYLRTLTERQLKLHFHRCVALNSLSFLKGGWTKPSHEETAAHLRLFDDAIGEINRRGLDMRQFDREGLSDGDQVYAGMPEELVQILLDHPPN
jgi:hypothetical protein